MKALAIALTALLLTGCYSLSNKERDEALKKMPGEIEQLKQTNEELKEEIHSLKEALDDMQSGMRQEIEDKSVAVNPVGDHAIQVVMQDRVLFASGSATLSREGRRLLSRFAEGVQRAPESATIRIVGHTDALPIGRSLRGRFVDNWELSAARAAAVARALVWGEHIEPGRLHIEAAGQTRPVADNNTAAGRAENRRIEIFLEEI